jgi:hypothetical protein
VDVLLVFMLISVSIMLEFHMIIVVVIIFNIIMEVFMNLLPN